MLIPFNLVVSYLVADIEPLQNNPDLEEGYCKALLCRLRFRKVLSYVYSLLSYANNVELYMHNLCIRHKLSICK